MGRRTPFSILSSLSCADSASTRPSSSESLVREAMSIETAKSIAREAVQRLPRLAALRVKTPTCVDVHL